MDEPGQHSQGWDKCDDFAESPESEHYGAQHDGGLEQMDATDFFLTSSSSSSSSIPFFCLKQISLFKEEGSRVLAQVQARSGRTSDDG